MSGAVTATYRGRVVTVALVATDRRPRLTVMIPLDEPAAAKWGPLAAPWEVEPLPLAVHQGPEAAGLALVAMPLHRVAERSDRVWVASSRLVYETEHFGRSPTWLGRLLGALRTVLDHLQADRAVDEVLRSNAEHSPFGEVRARSLTLLLGRATDPGERRKVGIRALIDRDPAVRLAGAMHVGALGLPTLSALVLEDGPSLDERRRALWFLLDRFADDSLLPTLVKIACETDPRLALIAVDGMPTVAAAEVAAEALARVAASNGPPAVRRRSVQRLCAMPATIRRPHLAALQARTDDPGLIAALNEAAGAISLAETGQGELSEQGRPQ